MVSTNYRTCRPREHVYLVPTYIGATVLMHPNALKSWILAAYINAERRTVIGVKTAGWDVQSDYDTICCEDVARRLIDHYHERTKRPMSIQETRMGEPGGPPRCSGARTVRGRSILSTS